jgi:hypothetical protein
MNFIVISSCFLIAFVLKFQNFIVFQHLTSKSTDIRGVLCDRCWLGIKTKVSTRNYPIFEKILQFSNIFGHKNHKLPLQISLVTCKIFKPSLTPHVRKTSERHSTSTIKCAKNIIYKIMKLYSTSLLHFILSFFLKIFTNRLS